MAQRGGAVHVVTTRRQYKGREYVTHLLRRSYREGDTVKNETLSNLSHLPGEVIELVRRALRGETFLPATERLEIVASKAHGDVDAVLRAMRRLDFASLLGSRACREADLVMGMVVARIVAPDTKLATTRWWQTRTLAEDLNVALPLSYWVRDAYTPPAQGDKSVGVKAELTQVDPTHVFWPVNTEYELFTVNGQRHTLGAVFVLNHKEPLRPAAPPVGPVAAEARAQGAILDLDKHSWPWSMMLVPTMNVDLFELANNHVWRTEFGFPGFGEAAAEFMNVERDARGFTEAGWLEYGFRNYYTLLNCGFKMRPTAGNAALRPAQKRRRSSSLPLTCTTAAPLSRAIASTRSTNS